MDTLELNLSRCVEKNNEEEFEPVLEKNDEENKVEKNDFQVSFKLVSSLNMRKARKSKRDDVEQPFESLANVKGKKSIIEKLIFEEDDTDNISKEVVDNKMRNIIDKFKPEKKNLKTGSLLGLLNFHIKTSPFLMCTDINLCEVHSNFNYLDIQTKYHIRKLYDIKN